ncbi:MAG: universal stress protein [Chloroflexota bacterium]
MFRHVLVPLDGSRLAEAALPPAVTLAGKLGAGLTLIHIIERNAPEQVHRDRHLRTSAEATAYLEEIAQRLAPQGIQAQVHVHTAEVTDVARSIVDHAHELEPDVIALCTHGRGGPRQLLFGSIAQQVIALGRTPVLLVRPRPEPAPAGFLCATIVVPLDRDPDHALALPFATALAQACGVALHLLMVVPTLETLVGREAATGRLLPGATRAMLEADQAGAEEFLRHHAETYTASGLVITYEVTRGDPPQEIVSVSERVGAGLIVMGVHGTLGSQAFWARSVPPKVSSHTSIPVLLIPIRNP